MHPVTLLCHHADRQAAVAYGLWRLRKDRQRVMGYIEEINALLVPRHTEEAVVLDLFAGCGGLALVRRTADAGKDHRLRDE